MKKAFTYILVPIMIVLVCGLCILGVLWVNDKLNDVVTEDQRMRIIETGDGYSLYVDTDTGVTYIGNKGFTVLVDRHGDPIIENGWRDWGGDDE